LCPFVRRGESRKKEISSTTKKGRVNGGGEQKAYPKEKEKRSHPASAKKKPSYSSSREGKPKKGKITSAKERNILLQTIRSFGKEENPEKNAVTPAYSEKTPTTTPPTKRQSSPLVKPSLPQGGKSLVGKRKSPLTPSHPRSPLLGIGKNTRSTAKARRKKWHSAPSGDEDEAHQGNPES